MAKRITYVPNRVIDTNGIADGATIDVFETGGTTPVTIYSDEGLTTPISNPYTVAAGAAVPAIYHNSSGNIRVRVKDSGGAVISDDDPFERPITDVELGSSTTGKGAALVSLDTGASVQDHYDYVIDPLDRVGGGSAKTLLGGVNAFPATTPSGDDAPNIIMGGVTATTLPASTYGNLVFSPRDNDVSASVGYRNRLGSSTVLSVVLGGDNDINALAAFNIGHHNRADTTGGGSPSHPMMIGTYQVVTEAYGVAIGTGDAGNPNQVHAIKAAAVGGESNRIGVEGSGGTGARNSFAAAGVLNTIDGQYAGAWAGNTCKAQKDYSHAFGLKSITYNRGEHAHSGINFGTAGDCQWGDLHVARSVSGTTPTQLLVDASATPIASVNSNSVLNLDILINAIRTDSGTSTACYRLTASLENVSGALTKKSETLTVLHEDVAAWNVDILISGSNWQLRFTADTGHTVRASAHIRYNLLRNI